MGPGIVTMPLRWAAHLASPAGDGARLTVLTYHRVLTERDPLQPDIPTVAEFSRQLKWIKSIFRILPLDEACHALYEGKLASRCAAITVDDGYLDNHHVLLPLLQRHNLTATFFIATGFVDGDVMFNDRICEAIRRSPRESLNADFAGLDELALRGVRAKRIAIQGLTRAVKYTSLARREELLEELESRCGVERTRGLMMRPEHLRSMIRNGMQLGGHTRHHPILRITASEIARQEISSSREDLASITGVAPSVFAFPNGRFGDDYDGTHPPMIESAGYSFAFTTHSGSANRFTRRFELPRFGPWAESGIKFKSHLVLNLLKRS